MIIIEKIVNETKMMLCLRSVYIHLSSEAIFRKYLKHLRHVCCTAEKLFMYLANIYQLLQNMGLCVFLEAAEIQDALTPDIQESTSTLLKDPPANTEPDRSGDLKILQSENFITRDCLTYLP